MPRSERVPTLEDMASRCREMAARARNMPQRHYLLVLAKDYEEQAAKIEQRHIPEAMPVP
jgi:hypothetical protein